MKTIKKLLFLSLMAIFALSSCNKDEKNGGEGSIDVPDYSEKSPEDRKADLEEGGIEMATELRTFTEEPADDVMANMAVTMGTSFPIEGNDAPSIVAKSIDIMNVESEREIRNHLSSSFKSLTETDPSLMDEFNDVAGTYSWNFDTEEWDFSSSPTDAIIFEFPGDTLTATNNATLTIDNLTTKTIDQALWEEVAEEGDIFPGDVPTSLDVTLEYEDETVSSITFSASYMDNGLPTNVTLTLAIGTYSFSTELNHTQNKNVNLTFNFSSASQTLMELYGEVSGDWSKENIENNTEEVVYEDEWGSYSYTEVMVEELIRSANAHYQVMDFKLLGEVDFQSLGRKVRELDEQEEDESITEQEYMEELAKAMNEHGVLALIYADGSGKIAEASFYAKEYEDIYCYYDYWEDEEVCEDYGTYWDIAVNLIFADDSEVDAEVYFTENFDAVVSDFNDLMSDLSEAYD
ncbi:MAG: hypothetical protein GVY19_11430 [Bacteroidetes bacterium]|jgi:hypothetical protein|nr:hypothetical protein [Bacteroidota bacterium]